MFLAFFQSSPSLSLFAGQLGSKDSHNITAKDIHDKTEKAGQAGHKDMPSGQRSQDRTAGTGQQGDNRWGKIAGRGQPEQDS